MTDSTVGQSVNAMPTPIPYPWKRDSAGGQKKPNCAYCCSEIPVAASYCTKCSKFQTGWKNWMPHLGAMIAALALSGSFVSFAWTSYQSQQRERLARQEQFELDETKILGDSVIGNFASLATEVVLLVDALETDTIKSSVSLEAAIADGVGLSSECFEGSSKQCGLILRGHESDHNSKQEDWVIQKLEPCTAIKDYAESLHMIALGESKARVFASVDSAKASLLIINGNPVEVPETWKDEESIGAMRLKALQDVTSSAMASLLTCSPETPSDIG